jgi:hypothetical protein
MPRGMAANLRRSNLWRAKYWRNSQAQLEGPRQRFEPEGNPFVLVGTIRKSLKVERSSTNGRARSGIQAASTRLGKRPQQQPSPGDWIAWVMGKPGIACRHIDREQRSLSADVEREARCGFLPPAVDRWRFDQAALLRAF